MSAHVAMMLETLIALLFAHVAADFVVQTRALIEAKHRPEVFAVHIGCVAVLTTVALGAATFAGAAAVVLITVTHAGLDALKIQPRVEARAAAMPFGGLQLFVLLGQFNAIGFVITAKSILRFQHARQPRVSEIVIIGTLASFGWAISVALLVHAALTGLRI